MGGLEDFGTWGLAWAMLAATAGTITAVVAAVGRARRLVREEIDFLRGYDALAPALAPIRVLTD